MSKPTKPAEAVLRAEQKNQPKTGLPTLEEIAHDWTEAVPTKQGWYWHWNGDLDFSPVPISVLWSGFTGKFFVAAGQLGLTHAIDCDEYGGWWLEMTEPKVPDR